MKASHSLRLHKLNSYRIAIKIKAFYETWHRVIIDYSRWFWSDLWVIRRLSYISVLYKWYTRRYIPGNICVHTSIKSTNDVKHLL